MNIYFSPSFIKAYKSLTKKQPYLTNIIKAEIEFFQSQPTASSLKVHKLKYKRKHQFSFSVEQDIRIVFQKVKDGVLLVDIGTHKQIY